jgi:hypothetical protein
MGVDGTGSGSCPVAGFGISGVVGVLLRENRINQVAYVVKLVLHMHHTIMAYRRLGSKAPLNLNLSIEDRRADRGKETTTSSEQETKWSTDPIKKSLLPPRISLRSILMLSSHSTRRCLHFLLFKQLANFQEVSPPKFCTHSMSPPS